MAITANPSVQNGASITAKGTKTFYNITANTVVKATTGRVARISVLVAGAAGGVYDAATVAAGTSANQIAVIPAVVGVYEIDFPVFNGIVLKPGAAQVLAISYI